MGVYFFPCSSLAPSHLIPNFLAPFHRASSTRSLLHCTPTACTFERYQGKGQVPLEEITFPRGRLLGAQSTRTRNGEVVNFE